VNQNLEKDIIGVILSEEEIQTKVSALGKQITDYYLSIPAKEIVVIGILRGAVVFLSDLIRHIDMPLSIDFMAISSYGNEASSSGTVRILKDISELIEGKHVLVVEDIIDTGLTWNCLKDILWARNPKSLNLCAFLNKPSRRMIPVDIDFCGYEIPDDFVVGYGLDYNGYYRHLPYVAILNPEVYQK